MLIEVRRKAQQIPVIQTGVAAGYRWSIEVYSLKDPSHMEIRIFAPRLMRHHVASHQYPINSISSQWDLPPRCPGSHVNPVYVFESDVKSLRTPVEGWFEVEYASRTTLLAAMLATAENSAWRVNSGLWHSPFVGRQVLTDWAGAYENMQSAASYICHELRKIEELVC